MPAAASLLLSALIAATAAAAPRDEADVSSAAVARAVRVLEGFDFPIDRKPGDPAEVALGRKLFFDARLSRGGARSCASCHLPERAYADGLPRGLGEGGKPLRRNTPSLYNAAISQHYIHGFFLDGRVKSIEDVVKTVIQEPLEFASSLPQVEAALRADPDYRARFQAVYREASPSVDDAAHALAAFVRSLGALRPSPFDRLRDEPDAAPPAAKRGLLLFVGKARCVQCHWNPDLTSGELVDTGLKTPPDDPERRFKVPSLRSVALTAPYMHDGSLATLADVVDFYDRGGDRADGRDARIAPLGLSAREKSDLVAFLVSLTNPPDPSEAETAGAAPAPERPSAVPREPEPDMYALRDSAEAPEETAASAPPCGPRDPEEAVPLWLAEHGGGSRLDEADRWRLVDYFGARAFVDRAPALCDRLRELRLGDNAYLGRHYCRNEYLELTLVGALLDGGPSFEARCREAAVLGGVPESDLCARLRAHRADPVAACEALVPGYVSRNWARSCREVLGALYGKPASCEALERSPTGYSRCRAYSAFARARLSGDRAACDAIPVCAALLGDGALVAARSAAVLRTAVCGPAHIGHVAGHASPMLK